MIGFGAVLAPALPWMPTNWFGVSSAPLANANVVDPTTGESLGYTDADGSITVTVPENGVIAVAGLAAIAAAPGNRQ